MPESKGKGVGWVEELTTSPFCRLDGEEESPKVGIDGRGGARRGAAMVAVAAQGRFGQEEAQSGSGRCGVGGWRGGAAWGARNGWCMGLQQVCSGLARLEREEEEGDGEKWIGSASG